jgi:hypothetical protein
VNLGGQQLSPITKLLLVTAAELLPLGKWLPSRLLRIFRQAGLIQEMKDKNQKLLLGRDKHCGQRATMALKRKEKEKETERRTLRPD